MSETIASSPRSANPSSSSRSRQVAINRWAQSLFDCRDILLPKGTGKGGQRRRADLRAILFTIATQGQRDQTPQGRKNGLWWTTDRIASTNGIGINQTVDHIDWLVSVGLVGRERRFNQSSILWINHQRLREIVQRQQDDRAGYRTQVNSQRDAGLIDDSTKVPDFDPEDLESLYFAKEWPSEALRETPEEAQNEAPKVAPWEGTWEGPAAGFEEPPF